MSLHKHAGGCHCGNIRVVVELNHPPEQMILRACNCAFCAPHGWRALADNKGVFKLWAQDWDGVTRYRFGTKTADFLFCKTCGVYVGAISETSAGLRGVVNVNCLGDRAAFTATPEVADFEAEDADQRLDRRAKYWMPAVVHQ